MSKQVTGYTIERLPDHIFLNVDRFEHWLTRHALNYDKLYNLDEWLMDLVSQNNASGKTDYCLHKYNSVSMQELFFDYDLTRFWDQGGNEPILYLFDMHKPY